MNYSLNAGVWNSVFAVPVCVVDKYLKLAGGNSLKLLLYLLRHGGEVLSDERIKRELGFTEFGELEDAALFWVQRGIIQADKNENGKFTAKELKADRQPETQYEQIKIEDSPKKTKSVSKVVHYSSGEIAQRINGDEKIRFLFEEAEKLFGHHMSASENEVVMGLTANYGLPAEVALMLLKYCFKIKKGTPAYIRKVAENWEDDSIDTVEAADIRIRALERSYSVEERLRQAMEMTTKLSAEMRKYIDVWTNKWGFGEEMIMLAYDKTIDRLKSWEPKYANSILERWNEKGIHTLKEAEEDDKLFYSQLTEKFSKKKPAESKPAKKSKNNNSSFDMDEVMEQIINQYN